MIKPVSLAGAMSLALIACTQQGPEETTPPVVDKAQDAASAVVGPVAAGGVANDTEEAYVPAAAMADLYEVQAANIALERTQNAQVRELAQMIKTDHTASTNMLKQAAAGMTPPAALDQRRQGLIDNLRSAPAADFDRTYLAQQVAAHQEALNLHRGFSDNEGPAPLIQHAKMVIPKIEMHLERARQLESAPAARQPVGKSGAKAG